MTDDFENDLRRLLNENVDSRVGPRRAAPAFDPDRGTAPRTASRRVRTRWLPPLLAAACIAVLVGGGVATSQLLSSDRNPAGPVTPAPVPTPTTAGPTPTSSPTPTATPSVTDTGAGVAPTGGAGGGTTPSDTHTSDTHTVTLGGARIALPRGWVAVEIHKYYGAASPSSTALGWCLTTSSRRVGNHNDLCPVRFDRVVPTDLLDVDLQGGYVSNPEPCGQESGYQVDRDSAERTFGGRVAEYRRWHDHCRTRPEIYVEQYVVPTGPGYILSTMSHHDEYHDVVTRIATQSTLPAQTAPVRLEDAGILRSIGKDATSVRITLDRTYEGGTVNNSPTTYAYTIPLSVWNEDLRRPTIGHYCTVWSDGHEVVKVQG